MPFRFYCGDELELLASICKKNPCLSFPDGRRDIEAMCNVLTHPTNRHQR